jgi:5-methylcytosine-specific restriction endonuclease McrA
MAGTLGRPCKEPRCPAIVTGKERYCEKHRSLKWGGADTYTGGKEPLSFYNTQRWQRTRQLKLNQNPICEVCGTRFATQVHHLLKARERPDLRFVMTNLQSICAWCHAKETQKETQETRNESRKQKPTDVQG